MSATIGIIPIFSYFFQVLAIERWNTDSVEEFLNTYLEKDEMDSNGKDYLETNRI